jgi:transglutaminase-like putative cysteine protease
VRAVGIPAREVFGMRLGKSHFSKALGKSDAQGRADISTWQHCRAEYFIPGVGWVPTDPADITKLMLVEGLKYSDPKVQALKDKYLHSWEMNWVGFNYGRDFILSPKPEQYPINMLGYPYGEVDGDVLNYYDPKEFGFSILSQEIK